MTSAKDILEIVKEQIQDRLMDRDSPVIDSVLVQFGRFLLKLKQEEEPQVEATKPESRIEAFPSLPSYSLEFNPKAEV